MSEENKTVELKDEELEKVTGGVTQNEDGTYNILADETFRRNGYDYNVIYNNYNVGLDTLIWVEIFWFDSDGRLINHDVNTETVERLLSFGGYISK